MRLGFCHAIKLDLETAQLSYCFKRLEFGQSNIARAVLDDVSAHQEQSSEVLLCAKYPRHLECALEVVFVCRDPRLMPQEVD